MYRFWIFFLLIAAGFSRETWAEDLSGGVTAWTQNVQVAGRLVRLGGVSFNARDASFRVIDNPPAARVSLSSALQAAGAVAGTNGNYFDEDFSPLGLVVAEGKLVHGAERAKLLSGFLTVRGNEIKLMRSVASGQIAGLTEALQTGPWLVEKGAPVTGLNALRVARRTVIATDEGGNWALIVVDPATLAETAILLSGRTIAGSWTIRDALNLDGGSSTMLTARSSDQTVIDIPSFGPVRNYLAIVPRRR